MKTNIIIYHPLSSVWSYFTTAKNWQSWWEAGLESITPGWQEGASMRWSAGEPTNLVHFIPQQQAGLQGKWKETIFRFADAPGGGTRLEVEVLPRSGASFPDEGKAHIDEASAAIDRLKRLLEGTPLPAAQPAASPAEPPALSPDEKPFLRGRSYVTLIFSMLAIGLMFSVIPCIPGVNTFFGGGFGAWLWSRREVTLDALRVRRSLLAGMLVGLGSTFVGTLFFLIVMTENGNVSLVLAIAMAMLIFLVPAALGGMLAGFVMRAQAKRKPARSETSAPSRSEAPAAASVVPLPPLPERAEVEKRMQASASQGLASLSSSAQADATRQIVEQVMAGGEFAFAVDRVVALLPDCLRDQSLRSDVQQFSNVLVAVTVIPAWTAVKVMDMLPGGYVALIQKLADSFPESGERTHLAHWTFTSDGTLSSAYLTVIPNPEAYKDAPALIPRELLTPQERSDLGV